MSHNIILLSCIWTFWILSPWMWYLFFTHWLLNEGNKNIPYCTVNTNLPSTEKTWNWPSNKSDMFNTGQYPGFIHASVNTQKNVHCTFLWTQNMSLLIPVWKNHNVKWLWSTTNSSLIEQRYCVKFIFFMFFIVISYLQWYSTWWGKQPFHIHL